MNRGAITGGDAASAGEPGPPCTSTGVPRVEVLEAVPPPPVPPDPRSRDDDQPLVTPLRDIGPGALDEVGGKALNLAELLRGGFRVPPGFCVTTSAYRRVTDHEALRRALDDLAATGSRDASSLSRLAEHVSRLVLESPVPADIATTVLSAYRQMGREVAVAVRSSATAEDLPFASFAGQQDTFLGVVGDAAVLTPYAVAGPRCGRPGPCPTAPTRASTRAPCGSPWSSSSWWTPRSPACCSRLTRSPVGGTVP